MRNYLANAMKYGGPDALATITAAEASGEVQVRVLDSGPGFPDADANRLFQLYYRSPAAVRKVSGSTKPSQANAAAFERAVDEIAHVTRHLLDELVTAAPPKSRAVEAQKLRERAAKRFAA